MAQFLSEQGYHAFALTGGFDVANLPLDGELGVAEEGDVILF